jgi:hypothetical protein
MLLIYAKNTAMKTGWVVTEDLIPPGGGRFRPARSNHPDAQTAELMCLAMSRFFREDTDMRSRPSLKQAYEGALKYLANHEDYKYLPATAKAVERILIKGRPQ